LKAAALACALAAFSSCGAGETAPGAPPPPSAPRIAQLRPRVLAVWPHDPRAFTQGLVFRDGHLYESTGLYGRSELREVELESGRVLARRPLPAHLFGEGLALGALGFVQLTYREQLALRWTPRFEPNGEFAYEGEGWGLTYDPERRRFVMSDGSHRLTFRDPQSFAAIGTVAVQRGGVAASSLNELEWTAAGLWSNVWMTDTILQIDLTSGAVLAEVDASALLTPEERAGADVLNGIAFDPARGVFYLTGKLWPRVFEVVFE
jgi:glutaminyl-peptide cyclotransferase